MCKIKHERTADCVVAGYRLYSDEPDAIGSLLLGLYTDDGTLNSVGVIGAFPMERRRELFDELQPLVTDVRRAPVGVGRAEEPSADNRDQSFPRTPTAAAHSRWNADEGPLVHAAAARAGRRGALRPHGGRPVPAHRAVRALASRTATRASCTYDQLDEPVSYDLAKVLGAAPTRPVLVSGLLAPCSGPVATSLRRGDRATRARVLRTARPTAGRLVR